MRQSLAHWIANTLIVLLLAACGGGGGGGSTPPTTIPPPTGGGTATIAQAQALLDTHADPVSYTTLGSIPVSGNASYSGLAYGDLANTNDAITDSIIGELDISVTFGSPSSVFSGQITDFIDENGNDMTGTLSLGTGSFDRSGSPTADPTIAVSVSGTLTDAQSRALSVNGQLEGDFLGSNHAAIGGEFLGTVTVSGVQQNLDGGFIAER